MELNPETVQNIHNIGGSILSSSRGPQDIGEIVDCLERQDIRQLFCIGGDGTLRGAHQIAMEVEKRGLNIGILGIPKTIDNDINFVEKTFGFETAVQVAAQVISSAHSEAEGAENGIGIVKLMGRDSGFIAATATLANSVVDFCLIPEACFSLRGSNGLIESLAVKLKEKKHAVVVVAEGAGQELFGEVSANNDSSENVLKKDIGELICEEITNYFSKLLNYGTFEDIIRNNFKQDDKIYSWWSYRNKDWKKSNRGRRLDHILISKDLIKRVKLTQICKSLRDEVKPSDHVPVICKL